MATRASCLAAAAMCAVWLPSAALADAATSLGRSIIPQTDGAAIYQHVCQACHMANGQGAIGAGAFPALAGNPKLREVGYPLAMVLGGNGGMPWFNGQLSDLQIANVVNYVRTHFGNSYSDTLSAADVAAAKGAVPVMER